MTGNRKDEDAAALAARNEKIIKLWNSGMNQTQLSARFSMASGAISNILGKARAAGVEVRPGRPGVKWPMG